MLALCTVACAVLVTAVVTAAAPYGEDRTSWLLWKQEHGKVYKDDDTEMHRFYVWKSNLDFIQYHNQHAKQHGFTLAMNRFGDLTNKEFNAIYNGFKMDQKLLKKKQTVSASSNEKLPNSDLTSSNRSVVVDWRDKGVVTPVMNQGNCGSCWAFSAAGSLEAQHNLSGSPLVALSKQNLLDCSSNSRYNNEGCFGGTMDEAFQYIIDNHGVDTEASYPYLAHTESKCKYSPTTVGAVMSKFVNVPINEFALTEACLKIGPISVAMDASMQSFAFYKSGVYYEPDCSATRLNHGVLLVGYGTEEDGKAYYLVKNSWGVGWGIDGYIKMSRNRNNNCGIATVASYPVV